MAYHTADIRIFRRSTIFSVIDENDKAHMTERIETFNVANASSKLRRLMLPPLAVVRKLKSLLIALDSCFINYIAPQLSAMAHPNLVVKSRNRYWNLFG